MSSTEADPSIEVDHIQREIDLELHTEASMSLLNQLFNRGLLGAKWSVVVLFFHSSYFSFLSSPFGCEETEESKGMKFYISVFS